MKAYLRHLRDESKKCFDTVHQVAKAEEIRVQL
jgi:hypothetical protein